MVDRIGLSDYPRGHDQRAGGSRTPDTSWPGGKTASSPTKQRTADTNEGARPGGVGSLAAGGLTTFAPTRTIIAFDGGLLVLVALYFLARGHGVREL